MTFQSNRFELINEVPLHQSGLTVTTVQISQIQATRATCSLKVAGSPVSETGAYYWTTPNPTVSQKKFILPSGSKTGTPVIMSGLKSGTTYYVRAYAKSGAEIIYGNELSFTTTAASPNNNSNVGKKLEEKQGGTK